MKYYEPTQPTNLQIIEKILADIYSRKRPLKNGVQNEQEGEFFCKLGARMVCYGSWTSAKKQEGHTEDKYANERIKLVAHGQIIANINIKRDAREVIQVFSARCGDNASLTREIAAQKQLQVFHAEDETADQVINVISNEIALSKAERAYNDKFRDYVSLAERLASKQSGNETNYEDELFASVFVGAPVPLPHDTEQRMDNRPHEFCNLRKSESTYYPKLTKLNDHFNGLKHNEKQKSTDHEIK